MSRIEARSDRPNTMNFVDDFNFEHSISAVSVTQIAISAGADFALRSDPRTLNGRAFNSPNCVYIG
jgi:hypothetical protein